MAFMFLPTGLLVCFCKTPAEKQISLKDLREVSETGEGSNEKQPKTVENDSLELKSTEDLIEMQEFNVDEKATTTEETQTEGEVTESKEEINDLMKEQLIEHDAHPREAPILFLMLSGFFLFLYVGAEVAYGGWIYTYSTTLEWASTTAGDFLTSSFWAALTFGRLLGVPLSKYFTARIMLITDMIGCLIFMFLLATAQTLVIFFSFDQQLAITAMWVCSMGFGLSMATVYPRYSLLFLPIPFQLFLTLFPQHDQLASRIEHSRDG